MRDEVSHVCHTALRKSGAPGRTRTCDPRRIAVREAIPYESLASAATRRCHAGLITDLRPGQLQAPTPKRCSRIAGTFDLARGSH